MVTTRLSVQPAMTELMLRGVTTRCLPMLEEILFGVGMATIHWLVKQATTIFSVEMEMTSYLEVMTTIIFMAVWATTPSMVAPMTIS